MRFRQVRHAVVLALLAAGLPAQGPPLPEPDISSLPETIRKELAEARKKAEAAPGDAQAAGEVGMLYFVYDLSAAAAGCFERAAALAPTELRWRYYLGLARERAGEPGGAIDALEQAVAIDASRPPVLVKLADLLRERDPSRAGELYRKALSSDPTVAAAHFGLGECARQAGRGEEALGHYRAAALASPEWAAPHYAAAMILASSGRREEATRHLRLHAAGGERPADDDPLLVALMSRGRNASMLRREAARLAKTGRVEDAIALLRQAIDTDVGGSTSRHHLGLVLAQNGRFEEAAAELGKVVQAEPGNADARAALGLALAGLGRLDEAETVYTDALRLHPAHAQTLIYYGQLLVRTGRTADGLQHLRRGVDAQPGNGAFQNALGDALARAGSEADAIIHLSKAVQLMPHLATAQYTLGVLLARSGDMAGARAAWLDAVAARPGLPDPYAALAKASLQAGEPAEAVRWAEKGCELTRYRVKQQLETLAEAYSAAGRMEDAARIRKLMEAP